MSTVRRLVREAADEYRAHPLLLVGIFAAAVIVGLGVSIYTRQPPVAIVTRSAVPTPTLTAPASAVPRQHHRTDQVPASTRAPPPSPAAPGGRGGGAPSAQARDPAEAWSAAVATL